MVGIAVEVGAPIPTRRKALGAPRAGIQTAFALALARPGKTRIASRVIVPATFLLTTGREVIAMRGPTRSPRLTFALALAHSRIRGPIQRLLAFPRLRRVGGRVGLAANGLRPSPGRSPTDTATPAPARGSVGVGSYGAASEQEEGTKRQTGHDRQYAAYAKSSPRFT